jgi:hypothetical protein
MPDEAGSQEPKTEPVFNTFRRKIYRPFFSSRETLAGGAVILVLAGVTGWVAWRGAHPEPGLFQVDESLLSDKGAEPAIYKRPKQPWIEPGTESAQPGQPAPAAAASGIFPATVIDTEWKAAGPVSEFDETNVYEKIDGREGFYKAFGFQRLHFLPLASASTKGLGIDIELFDMGAIENALGALAGEISNPGTQIEAGATGFFYASANSGFMTQGKFYIRMIGSDATDAVRAKITALRAEFAAKLPGDKLPWAYAVLTGRLGVKPADIEFIREDAFSIGGATEVYSAKTGGDMQAFVSRRASADEAKALAAKFVEGFKAFDKPEPSPAGAAPDVVFLKNEYNGALDAVTTEGPFVVGVRLAPDVATAAQWIEKLRAELKQLRDLPPLPVATPKPEGDGAGGH